MLQLFSASLPTSQSSRRLTPSQEIIISREQEDGEAEQEYIRARPEGDIYVNSGITGHNLPVYSYIKVSKYILLCFRNKN